MLWNTLKFLGFKGVILVVLFLLVLIVSLQNVEPININFLTWRLLDIPKLYVMLSCVAAGMVIGMILMLGIVASQRPKIQNIHKKPLPPDASQRLP